MGRGMADAIRKVSGKSYVVGAAAGVLCEFNQSFHIWRICGSMQKEREKFSSILKECINYVFGIKRVGGGQRNKINECWREVAGIPVVS